MRGCRIEVAATVKARPLAASVGDIILDGGVRCILRNKFATTVPIIDIPTLLIVAIGKGVDVVAHIVADIVRIPLEEIRHTKAVGRADLTEQQILHIRRLLQLLIYILELIAQVP